MSGSTLDTQHVDADTVVGIFPNDPVARDAIAGLSELGIPRDAIGVLAVERDGRPAAAARQGLLTGAALGGAGGALLEATILSFPPATFLIAGGTLVAALAGVSVGAGAGAAAGALLKIGLPPPTAHSAGSALAGSAGRVLVSVSSPRRDLRERARLLMRVRGAVETHDPDDASSDAHFAVGFASVVPQLKQHLREREGDERRWTQLEPRYRYGWQMANRPDFRERSWDEVVIDLRYDWVRRHAAVTWSEAAPFVEAGWLAAKATTGATTFG
jgi:hypothetical protein